MQQGSVRRGDGTVEATGMMAPVPIRGPETDDEFFESASTKIGGGSGGDDEDGR